MHLAYPASLHALHSNNSETNAANRIRNPNWQGATSRLLQAWRRIWTENELGTSGLQVRLADLAPPSLFVFGVCVRNWVLLHTAEFRRYTIGSLFCLSFKHLVQMLKYNEYHLSKRCFEGNSKVRYSNIIYFQKIIRLLKYRFLLISCYLIQWNNYLIILSTGFFQVYSLTLLVQQKLCVFTKLLGTLNTF